VAVLSWALAGTGALRAQITAPRALAAPAAAAAAANAGFDVTAAASGPVTALTLQLALTPVAADVGKAVKVFVAAWLPTPAPVGAWFLYDGRGWVSWTGEALKPCYSGKLSGRLTVPVLQSTDVRPFHGAALFMGYGTDADDMFARDLVKLGYTVDAPPPAPTPVFTLMTNPTDSALLAVQGADRTQAQYFGTRTAAGIPAALRRIEVTAADGALTRIDLDSSMRPRKLRASNGAVFELGYEAGPQAQVQVTSGDGAVQVSTAFPLGASARSADTPARLNALRVKPLAAAAASDWTIQVNRCGLPYDDAELTYEIYVPGQVTRAGAGMANGMGGGRYVASIPTGLKPSLAFENLRAAAESLADGLGMVCDALSLAGNPQVLLASMCPYIGAALTSVTGPGGVAISQACAAVTAAVTSYCKVLGEGGVINEPSLTEKILQGLKDPKVFQSVINLRADAYVKGMLGTYTAQLNDVPANGPHPAAAISITDRCGDLSTTNYRATGLATIDYAANIHLRGFGIKGEVAVSADSVVRKYPDEPCCSTWWQVGGREFRVRLQQLQVDTSLYPFRKDHLRGEYFIYEAAAFTALTGVHKCDGMPYVEFTGSEVTLPAGRTCTVTFVVNMKETVSHYDSQGALIEGGVYATGLSLNVEFNR
jgi:hypothetical protein